MYPELGTEITNLIEINTGERIPDQQMREEANNFFVRIGTTLAERFDHINDDNIENTPTEN
jgi:hypothetical protein